MPPYRRALMAILAYLEKEDVPFVFDPDTWTLYRMHSSDPETWTEIEDPDRAFHIRQNSCVISKDHAGVLADGLVQYAKKIGIIP
jgi:hypothetical protein